ncbi:MAG TPA: hypothetical protein VNB90_03045 [Cytophagaceae bacterium]|nr:hypothetical protein [Cytophagaceae bacterium]
MNFLPDSILTNEYAFTFLITFLSVSIKGIANKSEGMSSILKGESYDFGPELVFISISFAVSKLTQLYSENTSSPYLGVLKTIIFHLFILVFLIVFLRRISYKENGQSDMLKGMIIPLLLGFASLYVVLTYTLSI